LNVLDRETCGREVADLENLTCVLGQASCPPLGRLKGTGGYVEVSLSGQKQTGSRFRSKQRAVLAENATVEPFVFLSPSRDG
jgi:hypothetical protein